MNRKFCLQNLFARTPIKETLIQKRGESGQGLVELAISLIVILILLAGIVDLSRTIMTKMQLQDAAEEGVIYAMAYPKNCTEIRDRILDNLSKVKSTINTSIKYNGVICSPSGTYKGQLITVHVDTNFPVSMPFLGKIIGSLRTVQVDAKGIVLRN